MRISRIYHPNTLAEDLVSELSPDACNHAVNVLRLQAGDPIVLFNGDGNEYPATLTTVAKRNATFQVDAKLSISIESPLSIHLGQAVSRGDRMDFAIQKSVELGVSDITPLLTYRCGVKLSPDRWLKKHQQWQKLIVSACEQCGRNTLPTLHPCTELSQWLSHSTNQLRVTLDPKAPQSMKNLSMPKEGVRLLIGPEGGLTENEVYASKESGFQSVQLGPRVLRTETAAIAAIAGLQAVHGDL